MGEDLKFKIVYHIYRYGPKSLTELSKYFHKSRQSLHYNITQLTKEGVLIKREGRYWLQPLFDEENATDIFLKLIRLMTDTMDYLYVSDDVDIPLAVIKNFEYFLLLNLSQFEDIARQYKKLSHLRRVENAGRGNRRRAVASGDESGSR